jgi:AcrR family transcriptional regulator
VHRQGQARLGRGKTGVTVGRKPMGAAERRDQIVGVTLRVIARAAGVSEKMLYAAFGSRRGLLLAALDRAFDAAAEVLAGRQEKGGSNVFVARGGRNGSPSPPRIRSFTSSTSSLPSHMSSV